MPTINLTLPAGTQDGYSSSKSSFFVTGSPGIVGLQAGASNNAFFRFTGFTIPAGVTITSAVLSLVRSSTTPDDDEGVPLLKVRAQAAVNPTTPTSAADHDGRTRTTAGVDWDDFTLATDVRDDSPDIAAVIQELVDLGEVLSILILLDDDSTPSPAVLSWISRDGSAANSARLDITYVTPGGGSVRRLSMGLDLRI